MVAGHGERENEGIKEELMEVCGVGFLGNIGILEKMENLVVVEEGRK